MADGEGLKVPIEADNRDFNRKMDELERRFERAEKKGKKAGRSTGGSFFGAAAIGGAAGFVAGAVMHNPAVNSVTDLLINVLAAALLPVMQALLPVLQVLLPVLVKIGEKLGANLSGIVGLFGAETSAGILAGAVIGGKIAGPPGAVAGGAIGGAVTEGAHAVEQLQKPPEEREMSQFGANWLGQWVRLVDTARIQVNRIVGAGLV